MGVVGMNTLMWSEAIQSSVRSNLVVDPFLFFEGLIIGRERPVFSRINLK
jgi:hypothetical protein